MGALTAHEEFVSKSTSFGESEHPRPQLEEVLEVGQSMWSSPNQKAASGGLAATKTTSYSVVKQGLEPRSFGAPARKFFLSWKYQLFSERKRSILFILKTTVERQEGAMPQCEHCLTKR